MENTISIIWETTLIYGRISIVIINRNILVTICKFFFLHSGISEAHITKFILQDEM
jgi:hypothetical protein